MEKLLLASLLVIGTSMNALAIDCWLDLKDRATGTKKQGRVNFDGKTEGSGYGSDVAFKIGLVTENYSVSIVKYKKQFGVAITSQDSKENTSSVGAYNVQSSFMAIGKELYINNDSAGYQLTANCAEGKL